MSAEASGRTANHVDHLRTRAHGAVRVGRLFGFEVFVTWNCLLFYAGLLAVTWWYFPRYHPGLLDALKPEAYAAINLLLFPSVLLHEIGHALVARALGLPVRHILMGRGGAHTLIAGDAGGALRDFLLSIVGPTVNLAVAAGVGASWYWGDHSTSTSTALAYIAGLNAYLAAENYLPVLPSDGGRALGALLWGAGLRRQTALQVAVGLGRFVVLAVYGGVGYYLYRLGHEEGLFVAAYGFYRAVTVRYDTSDFDSWFGLEGLTAAEVARPARTVPRTMLIADLLSERMRTLFGDAGRTEATHEPLVVMAQGGVPLGVITPDDLQWAGRNPAKVRYATVDQLMTPLVEVAWIPPETDAHAAAVILHEQRSQHLLVLGEETRPALISAKRLEEIAEARGAA